jgi:acetyl esterase/lipase
MECGNLIRDHTGALNPYVFHRLIWTRVIPDMLGRRAEQPGSPRRGLCAVGWISGAPRRPRCDAGVSPRTAVGCFFAPTDFLNFGADSQTLMDLWRGRDSVDPSFQFFDVDPKTGARALIVDEGRILRILREVSPVSSVTPDDPPTILIHGDADQAVPLQQSQRLIDRLKAANVEGRLVVREGRRHAWPGWEADSELIAQGFDSHLHPSSPR